VTRGHERTRKPCAFRCARTDRFAACSRWQTWTSEFGSPRPGSF
jgi:hypothetical protein